MNCDDFSIFALYIFCVGRDDFAVAEHVQHVHIIVKTILCLKDRLQDHLTLKPRRRATSGEGDRLATVAGARCVQLWFVSSSVKHAAASALPAPLFKSSQ